MISIFYLFLEIILFEKMKIFIFILIIQTIITVSKLADICETQECKQTAQTIIDSMDNSIKPCDDFYQYSCGNWIKDHPVKDVNSLVPEANYAYLAQNITNDLIELMNKSVATEDNRHLHPLINFYKGCMNSEKREQNKLRDFETIKSLLKRTSGWPLIDPKWNESDFDIEKSIIETLKLKFSSSFLNIRVMPDLKNNSKPIITITSELWPPFGFKQIIGIPEHKRKRANKNDFYITTNERLAIKTVVEALTGSPIDPKIFDNETEDANKVSIPGLSLILDQNYLNSNYEKLRIPVKNLSNYKTINYRRILDEVLKSENLTVTDDQIIFVDTDYLKSFSDTIAKFSKRSVANKMAIDLVMELIVFTTDKLTDMSIVWGGEAPVPRSKFCIAETVRNLPDLLDRYYYEKMFDKTSIDDMRTMISSLKEAFKQVLNKNEWMDKSTKQRALLKLNRIKKYIGFPEFILNLTQLEEYHKKYENFSENNFLTNVLEIWSQKRHNNLNLFKNVDSLSGHWEWPMTSVIVNAFYKPDENAIYFPAGIANFPFYQHLRPNSINFGAIGMVISHELTHAFDNLGSQFDEQGNLISWISTQSKTVFKEKAQCFVQQYNNISYPVGQNNNSHINGLTTLGENIADNGGIRIAYKAMEIYKTKLNRTIEKLPGVLANYTDSQLFFTSFANLWCSNKGKQGLSFQLFMDPHSPEDTRVRQSLANFDEFSKVYNCPVGSKMNPKDRCILWG